MRSPLWCWSFAPTLVLELGRGIGSSTSLFQYWSRKDLDAEIVSLCISEHWQTTTAPRLGEIVSIDWERGLEARIGDILDADYDAIIADHSRVLLFWDAHGLAISETVMTRILPALPKDNIIVAHDMRDTRYFPPPGAEWLRAGTIFSSFEQIGPIHDYGERNAVPLCSASHALAHPGARAVVQRLSSDGVCYWHYFSAA